MANNAVVFSLFDIHLSSLDHYFDYFGQKRIKKEE